MQSHHEGWRPLRRRDLRHQTFGRRPDHREGALAGIAQFLAHFERDAALKQ